MNTHTSNRPPEPPSGRSGVSWIRLTTAAFLWSAGITASIALTGPGIASAATRLVAVASLSEVINNLRDVIVGLLVGLATLFATIGGVRYILAGGDPSEVESAKKTLKYAVIGYGVAILAPALVAMLQHIVGTE